MLKNKFILDACCGGRMFLFNKTHKHAINVDNRVAEKGHRIHRPNHQVMPDEIMDFRALQFPDNSFSLVVFDPPHISTFSETADMGKTYGRLNPNTWQNDLKKGFDECWRVLKPFGTLIFKWNEVEIKTKEILSILQVEPLFGHPSGSKSKTHWFCFMKLLNNAKETNNEQL